MGVVGCWEGRVGRFWWRRGITVAEGGGGGGRGEGAMV